MTAPFDAVLAALDDTHRLLQTLARGKSSQPASANQRNLIRKLAKAWFGAYRPAVEVPLPPAPLNLLDRLNQDLLAEASRPGPKSRLRTLLKALASELTRVQIEYAAILTRPAPLPAAREIMPDFSAIVADPGLRSLVEKRWLECNACVEHGLPLAATVMIGGLVEAMMLARINLMPDQDAVFGARATPKDRHGRPRPLGDWTLNNYIDVAHELGWITTTQRAASVLLRDYRNYIHPHKELQENRRLTPADTRMLWQVCKELILQLLGS